MSRARAEQGLVPVWWASGMQDMQGIWDVRHFMGVSAHVYNFSVPEDEWRLVGPRTGSFYPRGPRVGLAQKDPGGGGRASTKDPSATDRIRTSFFENWTNGNKVRGTRLSLTRDIDKMEIGISQMNIFDLREIPLS